MISVVDQSEEASQLVQLDGRVVFGTQPETAHHSESDTSDRSFYIMLRYTAPNCTRVGRMNT